MGVCTRARARTRVSCPSVSWVVMLRHPNTRPPHNTRPRMTPIPLETPLRLASSWPFEIFTCMDSPSQNAICIMHGTFRTLADGPSEGTGAEAPTSILIGFELNSGKRSRRNNVRSVGRVSAVVCCDCLQLAAFCSFGKRIFVKCSFRQVPGSKCVLTSGSTREQAATCRCATGPRRDCPSERLNYP